MPIDAPTVSVLLPSYNAAAHLETAIESLLAQTYEDFEIIIIDDGSTDRTLEIVRSFEDPRIELLERNGEDGLAGALNAGFRATDGRFIARHDADDRSHPTRLERQVDFLRDHPDVALVGTGATLIDESGDTIGRRRVLERPSFEAMCEHNHIVHGSIMMRPEPFEAVGGYDTRFETSEDYDLWLRLAKAYSIRNIDEALYSLRIRSDSVYGDALRAARLYHELALIRATTGVSTTLEAALETDGIEAVYAHLDNERRRAFHVALTEEFLRYNETKRARKHGLEAWSMSKTSLGVLPYLLLSFMPAILRQGVIRAYRRWYLNPRIKRANARP